MSHTVSKRPPPQVIAQWFGLIGAPLLSLAVYWLLPTEEGGMPTAARATAAVATLMAVLWMTEAMPLAATALLPIVLFPLLDVFPSGPGQPSAVRQAAAPYSQEVIFLFMGGFMMALAIERWNLHRRVALITVLAVGTRPRRLVAGFMLSAALLSMWLSNTATTVMMLPIGLSVTRLFEAQLRASTEGDSLHEEDKNFSTCLLLGLAYAATIGGVGTLIGTPPNALLAAYLEEAFDLELGFGRWMAAAMPLVVVFLVLAWLYLTRIAYPVTDRDLPGGRELFKKELQALGPCSRGEWVVLVMFLLTATLWVVREPLAHWDAFVRWVPIWSRVHDSGIAMTMALLLFAIPVHPKRRVFVLDWTTARRLPWGVLLLFGGGLSLAAAVSRSGLADWICLQLPEGVSMLGLIVLAVATVIFLTELTSNTATANVFLPILGGIAANMGQDPRMLAVPVALAASCAFMLPVATPPNAIVFGSGKVEIRQMAKAGLWLNLAGVVMIPVFLYCVMAWVLGIRI